MENDEQESNDRRSFLRRGAVGGAVLAAGGAVVGAGAAAAATGDRNRSLVIECAVLGHATRSMPMFQVMPDSGFEEGDVRGSPFFAEGFLYSEGSFTGDGFIPTDEGRIGTFLCRGHTLVDPGWPEPHLATHQEYYFGDITSFPLVGDLLASEGVEGANTETWEVMRIVSGGTGTYRGARGQVRQAKIGLNSTVNQFGGQAPMFRFEFDLDLP